VENLKKRFIAFTLMVVVFSALSATTALAGSLQFSITAEEAGGAAAGETYVDVAVNVNTNSGFVAGAVILEASVESVINRLGDDRWTRGTVLTQSVGGRPINNSLLSPVEASNFIRVGASMPFSMSATNNNNLTGHFGTARFVVPDGVNSVEFTLIYDPISPFHSMDEDWDEHLMTFGAVIPVTWVREGGGPDPTFTATVSGGANTLSQTLTWGGTAEGAVTLGTWNPTLPAGVTAALSGTTLTITDARTEGPAITSTATFTRQGLNATASITIPAKDPIVTPTFTAAVSSGANTLTQTLTWGGTAEGAVTLASWSPTLPAGVTAALSGTTLTITDARQSGPAVTSTATFTRGGINATVSITIPVKTPPVVGGSWGDVTGHGGAIVQNDLDLLARYVSAMRPEAFVAMLASQGINWVEANADVNGNGVIDESDVTLLRLYLAGVVLSEHLGPMQ
jgi:hypothetical protein